MSDPTDAYPTADSRADADRYVTLAEQARGLADEVLEDVADCGPCAVSRVIFGLHHCTLHTRALNVVWLVDDRPVGSACLCEEADRG